MEETIGGTRDVRQRTVDCGKREAGMEMSMLSQLQLPWMEAMGGGGRRRERK